jgi:DnaK suppressor protein
MDLAMDILTQAHLVELRKLLAFRQSQLRAEVHAAEMAARGAEEKQEDAAARRIAGDVSNAEEQHDLDELAQIDAALRRLDAGEYGDCADCGRPIGLARLRAQPAAERCGACQSAREARERG